MNRPPFQIPFDEPFSNWEIPLRYHKGWTIQFSIKREKFDCPILCLFNFNSVAELETAIDYALVRRNNTCPQFNPLHTEMTASGFSRRCRDCGCFEDQHQK
jgi:hypothetical protein